MSKTVHVDRTNLGKLGDWLDLAAEEAVWWDLEGSLTEGELVQLARAVHAHPGASSLLQMIPMHPLVGDAGLRDLTNIALEADDDSVLNAIVTLQKAPIDILQKLRRHPSRSVRGHVMENLKHRSYEPGRK